MEFEDLQVSLPDSGLYIYVFISTFSYGLPVQLKLCIKSDTSDQNDVITFLITTDGDEELPVFIERLGLSLASPRCKSLKQADYVELHCCLDFRFHNGGLLFAAQLFHNCNISRSQESSKIRAKIFKSLRLFVSFTFYPTKESHYVPRAKGECHESAEFHC